MGRLKIFAGMAGCLAIAASTMAARAADLLPPLPMPEPIEFDAGGWYLRGDVGVGLLDSGKIRGVTSPTDLDFRSVKKSIGDQVLVGVGVGYQFNEWLRADVTGEYRTQASWRYTERDNTGFVPRGSVGLDEITGNFGTVVALGNIYLDLGHWYGLTPFIGAGVGVAHHMFHGVEDTGAGYFVGGYGYARDRDTDKLAWAVHAGLAYDVAPNLKLELAYRYLNMGDLRTGGVVCLPDCASSTVYTTKNLQSNDIRIGMRWMLGGPVAMVEPPPPLIRKY